MGSDLDVACHVNVVAGSLDDAGLPAALDALAETGYTRVVLHPVDPDATDVGALRTLFADRGLIPVPLAGLAPGQDVGSEDDGERAAGVAALRRMAEFTAELGSDQLNGVPYGLYGHPTSPARPPVVVRAAREVGSVADYAHTLGVTMTFEVLNRYETSLVNTAEQAVAFVAASGSDHLRVHLDTFHMAIEEPDLIAAVQTALPVLGFLELGQSGRGPLGSGVVDIPGVVRAALAAGYRGPFGVEAFTRSILPPPPADMLAIWREPYADGVALARDAMRIIRDAAA